MILSASLVTAGAASDGDWQASGGELSLRGQVVEIATAPATRGGLSLTGRVLRPGLVSAGGALVLGATTGPDPSFVAGCECLCSGVAVFADGFESGGTAAWSVTVP